MVRLYGTGWAVPRSLLRESIPLSVQETAACANQRRETGCTRNGAVQLSPGAQVRGQHKQHSTQAQGLACVARVPAR